MQTTIHLFHLLQAACAWPARCAHSGRRTQSAAVGPHCACLHPHPAGPGGRCGAVGTRVRPSVVLLDGRLACGDDRRPRAGQVVGGGARHWGTLKTKMAGGGGSAGLGWRSPRCTPRPAGAEADRPPWRDGPLARPWCLPAGRCWPSRRGTRFGACTAARRRSMRTTRCSLPSGLGGGEGEARLLLHAHP